MAAPSRDLPWAAVEEPSRELGGGLLDRYQPDGLFDEAFDADGSVRATYSRIVERFRELDVGGVTRLEKLVADEFRRQGITFTVYSEEEGTERIWPMDLFPRLIAAAEWTYEQGVTDIGTTLGLPSCTFTARRSRSIQSPISASPWSNSIPAIATPPPRITLGGCLCRSAGSAIPQLMLPDGLLSRPGPTVGKPVRSGCRRGRPR